MWRKYRRQGQSVLCSLFQRTLPIHCQRFQTLAFSCIHRTSHSYSRRVGACCHRSFRRCHANSQKLRYLLSAEFYVSHRKKKCIIQFHCLIFFFCIRLQSCTLTHFHIHRRWHFTSSRFAFHEHNIAHNAIVSPKQMRFQFHNVI